MLYIPKLRRDEEITPTDDNKESEEDREKRDAEWCDQELDRRRERE